MNMHGNKSTSFSSPTIYCFESNINVHRVFIFTMHCMFCHTIGTNAPCHTSHLWFWNASLLGKNIHWGFIPALVVCKQQSCHIEGLS